MILPNAEIAVIEFEKIRDYCLNHDHPRGKHKAKVFESVLGITADNAAELMDEIFSRIQVAECEAGESDEYGRRYTVDLEIKRGNRKAVVRTAWIVKRDEIQPRLTTCYVK